ncbi:hypothetical protein [Nonomuraea sp. SYSU D8015]|uniref:hypothetical protein n=1 Tax=Nonomuraea sp. SYSU D8015 TaxID=2593644 RepID=UPI001660C5F7|nr:hypothetical protein [Nonomuraea sp. SYSU D8015]
MAYPQPRSMNASLAKGVREGAEYDPTPNRDGAVSAPTAIEFRAYRRSYGVR